ncbi:MAG: hypothetical protein NBV76_05220 [Candidatus Ochrobactrum gambitense]|nr:MAG: hypothetical protein NBV76_05220 [Candidatus Ochrobactrum gambitense]WEK17228.1 MAG: hypothetical protein P0Y54_05740 [Candidatus Ochrobactrum gambitense]
MALEVRPIRNIPGGTVVPTGTELIVVDNGLRMAPAILNDAVKPQAQITVNEAIAALNLGTASQNNTEDFATAAQGDLADSAVQSVNGKTGSSVTIDKSDVGLSEVDNTSDADKPVSTATQTALDAKADDDVVVKSVNGVAPVAGNVTVAAEELRLQDTALDVASTNIPLNANFIQTAGYATVGDGGNALYKRVASEPSHPGKLQSLDGAWWELYEHSVDPKTLGALGTGDVTTQCQNAMDTAFALGVPFRPSSGDFYIHGTITNPGVKVLGIGAGLARFHKVGVGNIFRNSYTLPVRQSYFITAVPVNSRSVTFQNVAHAANFSAGQFAIIGSQTRWIAGNPQRMGEFVKIRKVEGAVVTFWGPTKEGYLLSDQPELIPVSLVEGLEYRGFSCFMDNTVPVASGLIDDKDIRVIDTCFAHAPQFSSIAMHDANSAGIALEGCLGARVFNCSGYDFGSSTDDSTGLSDIGNGGFGYAVLERGLNENLVVDNLYAERCRHAYTTGASYIFNIGRPMNSLIANSIHRDSKESGFDTHEAGVGISFANCSTIGSGRCGLQIRSHRSRVINFYGKNCFASGLYMVGAGVSPYKGDECEVIGVYLENTNFGFGDSYDGGVDWRESFAVRDQGLNNTLRGVYIDGCGGPFYGTNSGSLGNRLDGAEFKNGRQLAAAAGPAIVLSQLATDRPQVRNVNIDGSNGRITDLVRYNQNSANCIPTLENVIGAGHTGALFSSAFANNQQVNAIGTGFTGFRESITLSGVTTFSLRGRIGSRFNINPLAAEHLITVTDAVEGRKIRIYGSTNPLNVDHGTGADQIFLKNGTTVVLTNNNGMDIERRGNLWYEV